MPEKLLTHPTSPPNHWSQAFLCPGPLQHLYNSLFKSSKHLCLVFLLAMTDVIFLSQRQRAMLHIPSKFYTILGPWIFFIRMSKFLPSLPNYDFLASRYFLTLQRNLPPSSASTCQFWFSFVGHIALCLIFLEISLWREYTQNPDKPLSSQIMKQYKWFDNLKDLDSDRGSKALANQRALLDLTVLTFRTGVPGGTSQCHSGNSRRLCLERRQYASWHLLSVRFTFPLPS